MSSVTEGESSKKPDVVTGKRIEGGDDLPDPCRFVKLMILCGDILHYQIFLNKLHFIVLKAYFFENHRIQTRRDENAIDYGYDFEDQIELFGEECSRMRYDFCDFRNGEDEAVFKEALNHLFDESGREVEIGNRSCLLPSPTTSASLSSLSTCSSTQDQPSSDAAGGKKGNEDLGATAAASSGGEGEGVIVNETSATISGVTSIDEDSVKEERRVKEKTELATFPAKDEAVDVDDDDDDDDDVAEASSSSYIADAEVAADDDAGGASCSKYADDAGDVGDAGDAGASCSRADVSSRRSSSNERVPELTQLSFTLQLIAHWCKTASVQLPRLIEVARQWQKENCLDLATQRSVGKFVAYGNTLKDFLEASYRWTSSRFPPESPDHIVFPPADLFVWGDSVWNTVLECANDDDHNSD